MTEERAISNYPKIKREKYKGRELQYFRTAEGTRPDLALVEIDGRKVVVKDFRRSARLFRLLIGPILIRRERGALLQLKDVPGIPQFVADIDRLAFVMEHVPGKSMDNVTGIELPTDFFDLLGETVRKMHDRGVAHCDMRSRGNVILGDDGRAYIVDFAACVTRGRGFNPFINWLFARFCEADDTAILRLKQRLAPQQMTDEEAKALARPNRLERPAVFIGKSVRIITRFLLARRK